ncbi:hypothetical protein, partial [Escherichia coli]|uniref:hypothetical protein n=1 Tax=Escherichia coli TaxID=562 RepID=UPI002B23CBFB
AAGRRPAPVNLSDLKHHHNISLVAFTGTGTEEAPAGTPFSSIFECSYCQDNGLQIPVHQYQVLT